MSSTSCMFFRLVDKRWSGNSDNLQPLPTGKSFFSRLLSASVSFPLLSSFSFCHLPSLTVKNTHIKYVYPLYIPLFVSHIMLPPSHPVVHAVSQAAAVCCWLIISGQDLTDAAEVLAVSSPPSHRRKQRLTFQNAQAWQAIAISRHHTSQTPREGSTPVVGGLAVIYIRPVLM